MIHKQKFKSKIKEDKALFSELKLLKHEEKAQRRLIRVRHTEETGYNPDHIFDCMTREGVKEIAELEGKDSLADSLWEMIYAPDYNNLIAEAKKIAPSIKDITYNTIKKVNIYLISNLEINALTKEQLKQIKKVVKDIVEPCDLEKIFINGRHEWVKYKDLMEENNLEP